MKILLVEDARAVIKVMEARLTSYGHEVFSAENGKEAVTQFEACAPDLVLMDIEMPVMNGFEATNRIRAMEATQQWAWTPIIFLTSSDTVQNLVTAIEAGGDDFMSKFAPSTVLEAKMKAMSRIATLRERLSVANQKLQDLANRDGLTGLCNRRSMDLKVDEYWFECSHAHQSFAILMLDIDNFKKYNDHYGHQQGDDCLRDVAGVIDACVQESNSSGTTTNAFSARYGGEEFAVILPNAFDGAAQAVAQTIVEAVRGQALPHEVNEAWGCVTLSIGGATCGDCNGSRVQDLFRTADKRLYEAKREGRNQAVVS